MAKQTTPTRQNMFQWSEQLDNPYWVKAGVTPPVVTPNQAANPIDGSATADRCVFSAVSGSNFCFILKTLTGLTVRKSYNSSVYIKGEAGGEVIWLHAYATNVFSKKCTLTTDFQRFDLTFTAEASSINLGIGIDGRFGFSAASPQTTYIVCNQLVQDASVQEYVKTEDYLAPLVNIIQNGDFEAYPSFVAEQATSGFVNGTASPSSVPLEYKWYAFIDNNARVRFDTTEKHGGSASLKLQLTGANSYIEALGSNATTYYTNDPSQQMRLKPNTTYVVSVWSKVSVVSGDSSNGWSVRLLCSKADGSSSEDRTIMGYVKVNQDWTKHTFVLTSNSTTAFGHIELRAYGHTGAGTLIGSAWFDDIEVCEANAPASLRQLRPLAPNYIANSEDITSSDYSLILEVTPRNGHQFFETTANSYHILYDTISKFGLPGQYGYRVKIKPLGNKTKFKLVLGNLLAKYADFNLTGNGSVIGSQNVTSASIRKDSDGYYLCEAISDGVNSGYAGMCALDNSGSNSYVGVVTAGYEVAWTQAVGGITSWDGIPYAKTYGGQVKAGPALAPILQNLVPNSQNMLSAGGSFSTVGGNCSEAATGLLDPLGQPMFLITPDTNNNFHRTFFKYLAALPASFNVAGKKKYISAVFKSNGYNYPWFYSTQAGAVDAIVADLVNGTVAVTASFYTPAAEIAPKIINLGSGFFFVEMMTKAQISVDNQYGINQAWAQHTSFAGNGTSGMYMSSPCISETPMNLDHFIGTSGTAFNQGAPRPKAPTQQNLAKYSNDTTNPAWVFLNGSIASRNNPDYLGRPRANRYVDNTAASVAHYAFLTTPTFIPKASNVYTVSCNVKAQELSACYLRITDGVNPNIYNKFDLSNGTDGGPIVLGGAITAGIKPIGNDGWYRIWMSFRLNPGMTLAGFLLGTLDTIANTTTAYTGTGGGILYSDFNINEGLAVPDSIETAGSIFDVGNVRQPFL